MAATETTPAAPAKKKRASFTRTPKPVFAIIAYTDENGTAVKLNRDGLSITFEKDASNLVELLTGDGMSNATVVKVELPAPATRAKSDAPAA